MLGRAIEDEVGSHLVKCAPDSLTNVIQAPVWTIYWIASPPSRGGGGPAALPHTRKQPRAHPFCVLRVAAQFGFQGAILEPCT